MLLVLTFLTACAPSASATCAVEQDAGTATATVDGEAWTGTGVTWLVSSGLQLNTVRSGAWSMVLRAATTSDGDAVADAIDAGTFPIVVALADDNFATLYPESGDSYASQDHSGELVIAEVVDDELRACFSFTATSEADESVTVEAGTLDALPFE
jgi:hypothetical protein